MGIYKRFRPTEGFCPDCGADWGHGEECECDPGSWLRRLLRQE